MKTQILVFAALFCFGVASKAQQQKPPKPQVTKSKMPRDSLPPPKVEITKFAPPKVRKDKAGKLSPPAVEKPPKVKFKPPVIKKDTP